MAALLIIGLALGVELIAKKRNKKKVIRAAIAADHEEHRTREAYFYNSKAREVSIECHRAGYRRNSIDGSGDGEGNLDDRDDALGEIVGSAVHPASREQRRQGYAPPPAYIEDVPRYGEHVNDDLFNGPAAEPSTVTVASSSGTTQRREESVVADETEARRWTEEWQRLPEQHRRKRRKEFWKKW